MAIEHELKTNSDSCQLYLESLFEELAVYLFQNYTAKKPQIKEYSGGLSRQKLQTTLDYIQANLETKIGLNDLAKVIQIGPYHFCRLFKKSTEITPYQYLIKCRIERAKVLLRQGKLSIADIALKVGFSN